MLSKSISWDRIQNLDLNNWKQQFLNLFILKIEDFCLGKCQFYNCLKIYPKFKFHKGQ